MYSHAYVPIQNCHISCPRASFHSFQLLSNYLQQISHLHHPRLILLITIQALLPQQHFQQRMKRRIRQRTPPSISPPLTKPQRPLHLITHVIANLQKNLDLQAPMAIAV